MVNMNIKKVGVVGCGLMGSGIAQVCAQSGYKTIVSDVTQELLDKGLARIWGYFDKNIPKGKATEDERSRVEANLMGIQIGHDESCPYKDLVQSDIVIEAIPEDISLKRKLFSELDNLCPEHTIFASNTSSLKISELAKYTNREDKFIGLHFFNPVPRMALVEVVKPDKVSDKTVGMVVEFVNTLGKTPIVCKDTTGFVVNRLLVPYLLDAIRALEAGIASKEDIDRAMMLGCGYPMGPLALVDYVGLDTTLHVAEIMFKEFKAPHYAPSELLKQMVKDGRLGKKVGKGFYDYK